MPSFMHFDIVMIRASFFFFSAVKDITVAKHIACNRIKKIGRKTGHDVASTIIYYSTVSEKAFNCFELTVKSC